MIKLMDLIRLAGVTMGRYKVHCATGADPTPLEAFYDGEFKEWQESQKKHNFKCDRVLSLIHMGADKWLFAGVYNVLGCKKVGKRLKYSTSEVRGLEHLTGKVVICFARKFRAAYIKGEKYGEALIVHEIKPEKQSIGDFPGYNKVCLDYRGLMTVIRQEPQSWKTALSNVSGIYLIADTKTGKQYIGSAYGDKGLWQRWRAYSVKGHGGNKDLRRLLSTKSQDYAVNFRFTILEVVDLNASKEYLLAREGHWKDALLTRQYGYNSN